MSGWICLVLLMLWTKECSCLSLTPSAHYIGEEEFQNFNLTCSTQTWQENELGMNVDRMRILKKNSNKEWSCVVEMDLDWTSPRLGDGLVGGGDVNSLWVTWPDLSAGGEFACDVIGSDAQHNSVYLRTSSVYVDEALDLTYSDLLREVNANSDKLDTCLKTVAEVKSAFTKSEKIHYWRISTSELYGTWPEGAFSLLQPESGCPAPVGVRWDEGYVKHQTISFKRNKDAVSEYSHMKKPVLTVEEMGIETKKYYKFLFQHFCTVHQALALEDRKSWPSGSYCIMGTVNNSCPQGFVAGEVNINDDITSPPGYPHFYRGKAECKVPFDDYGKHRSAKKMLFCCRQDGSPQVPIVLPTAKPFFLHRYMETCQQVAGMDVIPEYVALHNLGGNHGTAVFPDYSRNEYLGQFIMHLCYYEKRNTM